MNPSPLRPGRTSVYLFAPVQAIGADVAAHCQVAQRRIAPPTLAGTRGDRVHIDWRSGMPTTVLGRYPVTAHGFGKEAAGHGGRHAETALLFTEVRPA